ncbi:MAG: diguanylate cyclase domain-containing protein [Actinomycetales bacterium]
MRNYAWIVVLLVAGALAAVYFEVPLTGMAHLLLYISIAGLALACGWTGLWLRQPPNGGAWALILGGQTVFLVADVSFFLEEQAGVPAPVSAIPDLLYLCMYPLVIAGLRRLIRRVQPQRDWPSVLDAMVLAMAATAMFGALVIDPYLDDPGLSPIERVISIALPVMDIALVAIAAHLLASVRLIRPPFILLFTGLVSLLIGDLIYGIRNAAGSFTTGGPADGFWLGFYALIAAAALHPAIAIPLKPRGRPLDMTRRGIGLLGAAAISVPVLDALLGNSGSRGFIMFCSGAISLLVILRLATMIQVITAQERLARHGSMHDALTGLPNRTMLRIYLNDHASNTLPDGRTGVREADRLRCPDHDLALLYLDLDDFKRVNDALGHDAGDQMLAAIARRMREAVREGDLVARLAGDEFAILLTDVQDDKQVQGIIGRLREGIQQPLTLGGLTMDPAVSIGGVIARCGEVCDFDLLLREADSAMYEAKTNGKARYRVRRAGTRGGPAIPSPTR